MKLDELKERMFEINAEIKDLLEESGFAEYEELDEVEADQSNPNELFILHELRAACYRLSEASDDISYLEREIIGEYKLQKNSGGRYETPKHEYTCGNTIEFLYYDSYDEREKWAVSSVEHDGTDYYITGNRYKEVKLDGLTVRVRR